MKTRLRPRKSASDIPPLARGAPAARKSGAEALRAPPCARPPHSLAPAAFLTELPASYGISRLVLMVIDPYWIFAYWDITGAQMARACHGRPSAKTVLRVYDVTGANGGAEALRAPGKRHRPNFSFDIEIVPGADNWYIHLWSPQRSLYADLGLLGPEGRFVGITRSNRVETPPAQASPSWDERLATVGRRYKGPAPAARKGGAEALRAPPCARPDRGQRGKPRPEPARRLPAHAPTSVPVMPAIAAPREGGQTPHLLAHYQAPNVSVILPVRPMNDAAGAPAPQATLASLVANQTGPSSVRHAGSHPVPNAGHFLPAKPFIGSTTLVLEAVVAVRAPRKG